MPAEVEKVAICRLSGARAAPSCQHQYILPDAPVGTMGVMPAAYPSVVQGLPPSEPAVYEELFSVGSLSSELCPLHSPPSSYGGSITPLVDAELRRASVKVDRVVGTDGITRVVIKKDQH
jgi:hypothetical protein